MVALLIKKDADTEIREDYGRTPLISYARERGTPATIKALVEGGAEEVNARDKSRDTALNLAAWRGKKRS